MEKGEECDLCGLHFCRTWLIKSNTHSCYKCWACEHNMPWNERMEKIHCNTLMPHEKDARTDVPAKEMLMFWSMIKIEIEEQRKKDTVPPKKRKAREEDADYTLSSKEKAEQETSECDICGKSWEKTYIYCDSNLCLKCWVREKGLVWTPEMEVAHQRQLRGIPKGEEIKKNKCSWCAEKIHEGDGDARCIKCHGHFCDDCVEVPQPEGGCFVKKGYVCRECKEFYLSK